MGPSGSPLTNTPAASLRADQATLTLDGYSSFPDLRLSAIGFAAAPTLLFSTASIWPHPAALRPSHPVQVAALVVVIRACAAPTGEPGPEGDEDRLHSRQAMGADPGPALREASVLRAEAAGREGAARPADGPSAADTAGRAQGLRNVRMKGFRRSGPYFFTPKPAKPAQELQ
jgi:hypothetical protein